MALRHFPVLVLLLVCCFIQISSAAHNYHYLQCRRSSYRVGKVTAVPLGYCWKFMNHNYTYTGAFNQCKRFHARLPTVNTVTKAKKLSKFIAASIPLYSSGQMGQFYVDVYKRGWPGGAEFWMSEVDNGRWGSTKAAVSTSAAEQPGVSESGRQCVLFNYLKSTWHYVGCGNDVGFHPTICEEKEHVYADDVGADDMTTPSVTMAPTPAPPKGATFTCPEGYEEYQNSCFYLTKDRLSITDAEKACKDKGGRQVWISEASKYAIVTSFLRANAKKLRRSLGKVWLSRIEGNGYIFKWKSSGTNARYLLNRNSLYSHRLMQGVEPKFHMLTDGRVTHCRTRCRTTQTLCETDGIWKGGKLEIPHPNVTSQGQHGQTDDEYYYYED